MKIIQVEYSRLKSFGMYENEKIGYVAQVSDGETPEGVLRVLQSRVNAGLGAHETASEIRNTIRRLTQERDEMVREVREMEKRFQAAKAFLEKHHITLPQEEIPF